MARKELQEKQQAAVAEMQAGFADCKARFPDGSKQYIAKQQCDSAAAQSIRPYLTYPDLFDREQAERAVIAERLQAGKVTLAEANQHAAAVHSQIAEDEQRRNLAARSVGAQESAAAAAWRASAPVSCTRTGNTVNCF
ncbi:hypothetical protein GGD65_003196 [Bradyrhizobium sp. CIR18]|uniref:hypothetical protein n=1 Tax=Bradyrhizobium sp. CIR18 TaxID=2663839 RepID=UPI0017AED0D1|nr:hypothetical protein [Bradyrhizobium sp. CIR18]MBB4362171.1 hypothetical protein [Bradyrhizobium sp. CIR18]